jgi:geranylgeranyl pyrophosphate synthase
MTSSDEVLAQMHTLVRQLAASEKQHELLARAIGIQLRRQPPGVERACLRIPLLVHAAIRGDDRPALDLGVAMLLLHLGTDLLDDLADGDMSAEWHGEEMSQIQLTAIGLFATLPQLILARMDAPARVIVALQRTILEVSARMAAGQTADLLSRSTTESDVDLKAAWQCIEDKSGAAGGLLCTVGAILADVQEEAAAHYTAFGHAISCAACVRKDCWNLMQGATSSDLANGTRTYPLTLHLSGLRGESRRSFSSLLMAARHDPESRKEVLASLTAAGTFQVAGFVAESCRQRARTALELARPLEPAASGLRGFTERARRAAPARQ